MLPAPEPTNNCTDIMLVSRQVYSELVSLMLSGYDIDTSRFRPVRSEHYIATAWYFLQKKNNSSTLVLTLSQLLHLLSVFTLSLAISGTCAH